MDSIAAVAQPSDISLLPWLKSGACTRDGGGTAPHLQFGTSYGESSNGALAIDAVDHAVYVGGTTSGRGTFPGV